jgi:hypothetical protein
MDQKARALVENEIAASINVFVESQLKDSDPLYKYLSLESFLCLLRNKELKFTCLSNFEDTLEGMTFLLPKNGKKLSPEDYFFGECEISDSGNLIHANPCFPYTKLRSYIFCYCMTTKKDSIALWRLYSPNNTGVCIKTTIGKIKNVIGNNGYIAKIRYFDDDKLMDLYKEINNSGIKSVMVRNALMKRKAFDYEEEVRIVKLSNINDQKPVSGLNDDLFVKIENLNFIESFFIDPRCPGHVEKLIRDSIFDIIRKPIVKSDLYSVNAYKKYGFHLKIK